MLLSSTDITACDSYDWNGTTYTTSGSYTFTTTNSSGCDSTATLNLTINNSSTSSEVIETCGGYIGMDKYILIVQLYTYNTTTVQGCDSIATLNLTVNNSSVSSYTTDIIL